MTKIVCATLAVLIAVSPALGQHSHGSQTPYAGMQSRAIKSLSDNDIKELRRGGGWGLALAAELKGMPGPADLLAGQEPNAKAPRGAGPEAASRPAEQV